MSAEGIVLRYEVYVVGQVGSVGTLRLYVTRDCVFLSLTLERERELEQPAGEFRLAEVTESCLDIAEIG